jgi:hypothetical protein
MKTVSRDSIKDPLFIKILEREAHHDHEIVEDFGILRWKPDPLIRELADRISLNDLIPLFMALGHDKNSELYRKFYRSIGYSLLGYWEIFYWEANNPSAPFYNPQNSENGKKNPSEV